MQGRKRRRKKAAQSPTLTPQLELVLQAQREAQLALKAANPGRRRIKEGDDRTVRYEMRIPRWMANWLEMFGGGKRGAIPKAIRRLVKEQQGRDKGKQVEIPAEEYKSMVKELKRLRKEAK